MEEDVPQTSTVPPVEEDMASHMRNDSLVTVRLSEPVHLRIDTKFDTKEESPDDQLEQHDTVLLEEEPTIMEDVEEEERTADRLSSSSGISTVKPEGQSLAAELDTENLSAVDSRRGSGTSNISTTKAEAQNDVEELDPEELTTIQSRRGSKLPRLSTIRDESQSLAAELETEDSSASTSRRGSNDSDDGDVNWAELQKNEAEEPKDEGSEDVSDA